MNASIIGFGKMGRQIEKFLKEKKINISSTIDNYTPDASHKEVNKDSLKGADVAIEFAVAEGLIDRIKTYTECNVNVVLGTTGWYDKIDEIKKITGNKIGFIWSGNFSLGVNIYFKIIKESAKIFNKFKFYDPMLCEYHHNQKKDSPSGTAKMIGKILINELDHKTNLVDDKLDRKINENEIHIASVRGGFIPGTHTVLFDSQDDTIEIKHTARNREGLARGAVLAAEWIIGKKGFFNIDDLMNSII